MDIAAAAHWRSLLKSASRVLDDVEMFMDEESAIGGDSWNISGLREESAEEAGVKGPLVELGAAAYGDVELLACSREP